MICSLDRPLVRGPRCLYTIGVHVLSGASMQAHVDACMHAGASARTNSRPSHHVVWWTYYYDGWVPSMLVGRENVGPCCPPPLGGTLDRSLSILDFVHTVSFRDTVSETVRRQLVAAGRQTGAQTNERVELCGLVFLWETTRLQSPCIPT